MDERPRRFTVLDAMVLTAATAACLPSTKLYLDAFASRPEVGGQPARGLAAVPFYAASLAPLLASWSLAVSLLGLRRPRPPLRRLAARPGYAGCVAASAAVLLAGGLVFAYQVSLAPSFGWPGGNAYAWWTLVWPQAGSAVLAAWVLLVLAGRWRAEPLWIDRLGRILAIAWLGMVPACFWVFLTI